MKFSKIIAILLALIMLLSCSQLVAFAQTSETYESDNITIIFHNEVSETTKEKIITNFTGTISETVESKGLTCSLFGHDLESGTTSTITHKAKSTAPRCLMETYQYQSCSRCDYYESTFLGSEYIYCCS